MNCSVCKNNKTQIISMHVCTNPGCADKGIPQFRIDANNVYADRELERLSLMLHLVLAAFNLLDYSSLDGAVCLDKKGNDVVAPFIELVDRLRDMDGPNGLV